MIPLFSCEMQLGSLLVVSWVRYNLLFRELLLLLFTQFRPGLSLLFIFKIMLTLALNGSLLHEVVIFVYVLTAHLACPPNIWACKYSLPSRIMLIEHYPYL